MKTALRKQGGFFKRHKRTSVLAKWFEYDVSYELPLTYCKSPLPVQSQPVCHNHGIWAIEFIAFLWYTRIK